MPPVANPNKVKIRRTVLDARTAQKTSKTKKSSKSTEKDENSDSSINDNQPKLSKTSKSSSSDKKEQAPSNTKKKSSGSNERAAKNRSKDETKTSSNDKSKSTQDRKAKAKARKREIESKFASSVRSFDDEGYDSASVLGNTVGSASVTVSLDNSNDSMDFGEIRQDRIRDNRGRSSDSSGSLHLSKELSKGGRRPPRRHHSADSLTGASRKNNPRGDLTKMLDRQQSRKGGFSGTRSVCSASDEATFVSSASRNSRRTYSSEGGNGRRGRSVERQGNSRTKRSRSRTNFDESRSRSRSKSLDRSCSSFDQSYSGLDRNNNRFERSRSLERTRSTRRPPERSKSLDRQISRRPSRGFMNADDNQSVVSMYSTQSHQRPTFGKSLSNRRNFSSGESVRSVGTSPAALMTKQGSGRTMYVVRQPSNANIGGTPNRRQLIISRAVRRFRPPEIKRPPKTLVLIWIVVGAELIFDLNPTIISFRNLASEDECCDELIDLGPIPIAVTIPYLFLVVTEIVLLLIAIKVTLFPPVEEEDFVDPYGDRRPWIVKKCVQCLQLNASALLTIINWLVMINPFFGSIVAWMLLYQSEKSECFTVLGFEAAGLFLHFVSVWLEGEKLNKRAMLLHAVPILPFLISIILIFVYLNQGGVCYLVEESLFWYAGCQVCEDGNPPVDGICTIGSGENQTAIEVTPFNTRQDTFCGEEVKFCFFEY